MASKKEICNDFITMRDIRAWQTCAIGLRRSQAETRIGGSLLIPVAVSLKCAVASILSSFAGNLLTAIGYINARKPLPEGARML